MTKRALKLFVVVLFFALSANLFAADDKPLKLVIAHGPGRGDLEKLAKYLEANHNVECRFVAAEKASKPKGSKKPPRQSSKTSKRWTTAT